MDYWLLSDKQNKIRAHTDSNLYEISSTPDKMINHPPFLVCSFRNTDENNLRNVERLFPDEPQKITLDTRPVNVGLSKMDLRKEKLENVVASRTEAPNYDNSFNPLPFNANIPTLAFTPGKAEASGYAKAIDVESRLKRIDFNDNLCYVKNYNPNSDLKTHYEILKKDYRIPIRKIGANKCVDLELPSVEKDEYQFELGNTAEKFFYNNTRRKTQKDW